VFAPVENFAIVLGLGFMIPGQLAPLS